MQDVSLASSGGYTLRDRTVVKDIPLKEHDKFNWPENTTVSIALDQIPSLEKTFINPPNVVISQKQHKTQSAVMNIVPPPSTAKQVVIPRLSIGEPVNKKGGEDRFKLFSADGGKNAV